MGYWIEGIEVREFSAREIQALVEKGQLDADTRIRKDDESTYVALAFLSRFAFLFGSGPSQVANRSPTTPSSAKPAQPRAREVTDDQIVASGRADTSPALYRIAGDEAIAVNAEKIALRVRSGELGPETQVRRDGESRYEALTFRPEFMSLFDQPAPQPARFVQAEVQVKFPWAATPTEVPTDHSAMAVVKERKPFFWAMFALAVVLGAICINVSRRSQPPTRRFTSAEIDEAAFLLVVIPTFPGTRREDLVNAGHAACKMIESYGGNVNKAIIEVALHRLQPGSPLASFSPQAIGKLMGAAASSFCPEYR